MDLPAPIKEFMEGGIVSRGEPRRLQSHRCQLTMSRAYKQDPYSQTRAEAYAQYFLAALVVSSFTTWPLCADTFLLTYIPPGYRFHCIGCRLPRIILYLERPCRA